MIMEDWKPFKSITQVLAVDGTSTYTSRVNRLIRMMEYSALQTKQFTTKSLFAQNSSVIRANHSVELRIAFHISKIGIQYGALKKNTTHLLTARKTISFWIWYFLPMLSSKSLLEILKVTSLAITTQTGGRQSTVTWNEWSIPINYQNMIITVRYKTQEKCGPTTLPLIKIGYK